MEFLSVALVSPSFLPHLSPHPTPSIHLKNIYSACSPSAPLDWQECVHPSPSHDGPTNELTFFLRPAPFLFFASQRSFSQAIKVAGVRQVSTKVSAHRCVLSLGFVVDSGHPFVGGNQPVGSPVRFSLFDFGFLDLVSWGRYLCELIRRGVMEPGALLAKWADRWLSSFGNTLRPESMLYFFPKVPKVALD